MNGICVSSAGASWDSAARDATRLICFPSPGASTGPLYESWQAWLHPDLEVACLPGRLLAAAGPAEAGDVQAVVRALLPSIKPLLDRPYALYGHGLGALAAFEACRALEANGTPKPLRLCVSGLGAPRPAADRPHLRCPITVFCGLQDEALDLSCLKAWQELTEGECELCLIPGGTSFLTEHGHLVASGLLRRFEAMASDSRLIPAGALT